MTQKLGFCLFSNGNLHLPAMTSPDAATPHSEQPSDAGVRKSVKDLLDIPWFGLRPDLVLHPGPVDSDGQRSWVLEDPVRGANFRLGYAEGELLYRLVREHDPDAALSHLYQTTTLRPGPEDVAMFIAMLQRESLANIPPDVVVEREKMKADAAGAGLIQKLLQGTIFFRVPLIRPDKFLSKTFPYVKALWSPFARWMYAFCGVIGALLTLQEIELYFSTVNYLFTPQGGLAFVICLVLLKVGHEFCHAYTAKALGLHVRSMGVFFIVFWPLLYTDTTEAWKIPNRRHRIWISAAGVLFELCVGGLALLLWALLPGGVLKSLMFFLSGASLVSSVLINLNPFMRYDGYYVLMDLWGVDNLRPRAFAMFRHFVRRLLLDWKGAAPEIHPQRRRLILYGFLAMLYRLLIGFSIAVAVYYLLFPVLGLLALCLLLWLFIVQPLIIECRLISRHRHLIGSRRRLVAAAAGLMIILLFFILPLPRFQSLPCLLLYKETARVETPAAGRLAYEMPAEGAGFKAGAPMMRLVNDALMYETRNSRYDLESVRRAIQGLGGGGEQGAYRNWLLAEEKRLMAALEKNEEAIAQLEIRAPLNGVAADVNQDMKEGDYVPRGAYLFTLTGSEDREVRAYVHEQLVEKIGSVGEVRGKVHFLEPGVPALRAALTRKSLFPVRRLPNNSLYEIAGGPITSAEDKSGRRPVDAYFAFTFDVADVPSWMPHGMPCWIWAKSGGKSLVIELASIIWKNMSRRGVF